MRKFLFSTFLVLFGLIFLVFLVANRQPITISFDPLSTDSPAFAIGPLPLWAALVATLFLGYLFGGLGMWLSGKGTRRKATDRKHEIKQLKREIEAAASAPTQPTGEKLPVTQR